MPQLAVLPPVTPGAQLLADQGLCPRGATCARCVNVSTNTRDLFDRYRSPPSKKVGPCFYVLVPHTLTAGAYTRPSYPCEIPWLASVCH